MNTKTMQRAALWVLSAVVLAGCAVIGVERFDISSYAKASFAEKGPARLDRLDQSDLQRTCSEYALKPLPDAVRARLEKQELARIKYPSDGRFLGDWKQGEAIAQSGRGLQFSDAANTVAGGNCYACHQLTKEEVSYGTIGPSLHHYGKLRGNSEPILKYTWGKIWNAHAFNACTNMPRFGDAGILSEAQLRHVMALLLDPASPVNR
jgi:L-cysteine S-thiosulfotransferase